MTERRLFGSVDDQVPTASLSRFEAGPSARGRSAMPLTGATLGAYVVALVLFSESPSTFVIAMVLGFLLAAVFVTELITQHQPLRFPSPLIWFAVFLCYCTLHMVFVPGRAGMLLTLYQLFILAVIIVNYGVAAGDPAAFDRSVYVAVVCTFIYNLVAHPPVVDGRVGSTLVNPNSYALVLLIGLLLAARRILLLTSANRLTTKAMLFFIFYFSLSIYGLVFLAGSRKGIVLGLAASVILILYWLWQQPGGRRLWLSILILAVFVLLGYVFYQSPQFSRVTELSRFVEGAGTSDTSLLTRDQMLRDGLVLWQERPFLGFGLDRFRNVSGWGTYSHNNYVELLVGTGLIGLLLYVMIYFSAFVSFLRLLVRSRDTQIRADNVWAVTALAIMITWDLAAVTYYDKFSWITTSVLIGVAAGANERHRAGVRMPQIRQKPETYGKDAGKGSDVLSLGIGPKRDLQPGERF